MVRGRIEGGSHIHKFGEADTLPTGTYSNVWDGQSSDLTVPIPQYTYSTVADIDTISSSNSGDVGRIIEIQGLDGNFDPVVQTVTTNGQNKVTLLAPLMRVFRIRNLSPVGGDILGNLFVYVDTAVVGGVPTDTTKVRGIIRDGHNQTQMAQYSVPRGYKLYITHGWSNISKAGGATVIEIELQIRHREVGKVWRELHKTSLISHGVSASARPYTIPIPFDGNCELEYKARPSAAGLAIASGFHGFLLREDYVNSKPITYYP